MAARALRSVDQMAMDETVIEDAEIENALELRDKRKHAAAAVAKEYKEANVKALAAIERLELPEGAVARVGRFRISRVERPGRHVEFDAEAKTAIKIAPIVEE